MHALLCASNIVKCSLGPLQLVHCTLAAIGQVHPLTCLSTENSFVENKTPPFPFAASNTSCGLFVVFDHGATPVYNVEVSSLVHCSIPLSSVWSCTHLQTLPAFAYVKSPALSRVYSLPSVHLGWFEGEALHGHPTLLACIGVNVRFNVFPITSASMTAVL